MEDEMTRECWANVNHRVYCFRGQQVIAPHLTLCCCSHTRDLVLNAKKEVMLLKRIVKLCISMDIFL